MKEISLSQGKVALVDDDDFEELSKYKWHANKHRNTYYAECHIRKQNGKYTKIRMHQFILGKKIGFIIDHKDGEGLNNQRHNIRHVTKRQNGQNLHIPKSSKYPGVTWDKQANKWKARIKLNGKEKHIGLYMKEIDAFKAYKNTVKSLTLENVINGVNN